VGVSGSGGVLSEVLVLFFFSYRNPASHENHQQKKGRIRSNGCDARSRADSFVGCIGGVKNK
jgi:hypothetical protein